MYVLVSLIHITSSYIFIYVCDPSDQNQD